MTRHGTRWNNEDTVKPKQTNTLPYILGSLGLIAVAIVFSSILNSTSNPQNQTANLETRASSTGLVKATGVVSGVDTTTNTIKVNDLRFTDSTKSLGTWTVTPPASFNTASAFPGSVLTITIDPPTMLAIKRTLTATDISLGK